MLFPSDCRLCGTPLVNISRLPVCEECLSSMRPIAGGSCSICGERLFSPYAFLAEVEARCGLCRRLEPPFVKAVAYGSYEGGLRELIHILKYGQVRPAANVLQCVDCEKDVVSARFPLSGSVCTSGGGPGLQNQWRV